MTDISSATKRSRSLGGCNRMFANRMNFLGSGFDYVGSSTRQLPLLELR